MIFAHKLAPSPQFRDMRAVAMGGPGAAARIADHELEGLYKELGKPAAIAIPTIIGLVTGLLPAIKEIFGLIPNNGKKKQLVAAMARSAESSLRAVAEKIGSSGSSLEIIAMELRAVSEAGRDVTPAELRMLALAVDLAVNADSSERQSQAAAVIAGCDALDASIDHLVGAEDK